MNSPSTQATVIPAPDWIRSESSSTANWFSDFLAVTKARANIAVVATTFVGFALHADILPNWTILLHTLAGTALLAGSASMANQAWEYEHDRRMARTRNRPIAAGRLRRRTAFSISAVGSVTGCLWLGAGVNSVTMLCAALAFLVYFFGYTPLKRCTPACTLVGAVSGALPLLVGWAATGANFGLWAALAFAVLLLWQLPHFLAIAWWRRSDYLGAGYRVLPRRDHNGRRTAVCALVFALLVSAIALIPAWVGRANLWYGAGAVLMGVLLSASSVRFLLKRDENSARSLFLASLYYLPVVYALMLLGRT